MKRYAIGIDVGGTNLRGVVLREKGQWSHFTSVPTGAGHGGKRVLDTIMSVIETLIAKHGTTKNLLGIGIGTPGTVDAEGKVVGGALNLPGWEGARIYGPIRKQFGLPVTAMNDALAMTLAEWRFGAGKGLNHIVCLTLGTGLGGGIVTNGRLYRGAYGLAGEFGHIPVDYNGEPCACGQKGCVELYASATGIVRTAVKVCSSLGKGRQTAFSKLVNEKPRELTSKTVYDFVKICDRAALQVNEMVCEKLARTVGMVINAFAPDRIILGGGVMMAGKIIIDTTRKYVPLYSLTDSRKHCRLVRARCGGDAGVIGAAQLVFEKEIREGNV